MGVPSRQGRLLSGADMPTARQRAAAVWAGLALCLAACGSPAQGALDHALREFTQQTSIDQRPVYQVHGTSVVRGEGEILAVFPPDPRSQRFAAGAEILYREIRPSLRSLTPGRQLSPSDAAQGIEARASVEVSYVLSLRAPAEDWSQPTRCSILYNLVRKGGAWANEVELGERPLPQCGPSPEAG